MPRRCSNTSSTNAPRCGWCLDEEVGSFGSGVEHLYRCLKRLALVTPLSDGERRMEELPARPRCCWA
jgi:hypothetical protein